ncbi:hypothetical protein ILUMI_03362 [Ignelater luminosus]|uniref:Exonuclease domain-containing protein n=1 Tax=Ignelater luminosus TaxID=2038154 RepID=A0A8K0DGF5_IGNLU|nr:hypothetical protein ILUMI_03362 [Ignelater luminosus]
MLPTTGFFKNIDCPFYESSCERPYCHFKHRKKTQEQTEIINAVPLEIPTYNPTPKSQLANAKSHIPISYVPDLAIRTDRNFRSLSSSYGYTGGDKPTYKPTPLSILSTGKINSIKSNENTTYNPTAISSEDEEITNKLDSNVENLHGHDDSNDINFEDLETEFDMIDELIHDSDVNNEINGEDKDEDEVLKNDKLTSNENIKLASNETTKSKHKSSSSSSSSSRKSKHNGKEKESTSSKLKLDDKKSKHRSHSSSSSSHKKRNSSGSSGSRSESKSSGDKKDSKSSNKSSSKDDRKRSRSKERKKESGKSESRDRKHESKDKHKNKESSRHSHKSKTKERDKERKSEEKRKHKESSKNDDKLKEKLEEKLDMNSDESNDEECDLLPNYDNEDSDVEEDTLEECYKIFTEYKPTEPELFPELKKLETNSDENSTMSHFNKKRIAHENADKMKSKVLFNKPKYVPSAAQMMVNRLKAARLAHANNEQDDIMTEINKHIFKRPSETVLNDTPKVLKTSVNTKVITTKPVVSKPSTSSSLIDDIISGKSTTSKPRRIAPVQNVDSIQRAKAKLQEMAKIRAINMAKTATQSVAKGVKRTAHVPEYSVADVPDVLEAERSKLPVNVRSRYLTMILDECAKLYLSKEEAQQRALNEEYKCYERCAALVTYRNSAMLAVNRLRKELQEREIQGLGPIFPGEVLDSSKGSASDLRGRKFYENIKRFILNDEELVLHGFPREGTMPGQAIIKNQKYVSKGYLGENDRICCRCLKLYKVDEQGFALYEEECLYHPLKKRTFRGESIYLCCRSSEDTGCVTAGTHVCENIISNDGEIEGYQTTMPPDRKDDPRSYEVFALDCEMCYTTKGLELTRVTIVNSELKTVYETLVKPLNTIIDYNTRFSGITEEQMNRTATSILQVQANILHLCNSNTILIGHSLESDMKALKIIHNTIVDTSVLFPHKFGLPHKRALRDLAREFLKKIIQNDISGHDSAEDALTCMELVQWKVKEELKGRGIKV